MRRASPRALLAAAVLAAAPAVTAAAPLAGAEDDVARAFAAARAKGALVLVDVWAPW